MLFVKWFWHALLLLTLIGSSFSLKCELCDEKTCKEVTCDKSQDHCVAAFLPSGKVYRSCADDVMHECKIADGGCVTKGCNVAIGRQQGGEKRICACTTDNCNRGDFKQKTNTDTGAAGTEASATGGGSVPVSGTEPTSKRSSAEFGPSSQAGFVFGSAAVVSLWKLFLTNF